MSDYTLHPLDPGESCQSHAHRWPAPAATVDVSVYLCPGIFAHTCLCRECADTLPGATDSAPG